MERNTERLDCAWENRRIKLKCAVYCTVKVIWDHRVYVNEAEILLTGAVNWEESEVMKGRTSPYRSTFFWTDSISRSCWLCSDPLICQWRDSVIPETMICWPADLLTFWPVYKSDLLLLTIVNHSCWPFWLVLSTNTYRPTDRQTFSIVDLPTLTVWPVPFYYRCRPPDMFQLT
jgi:hypothetical protein